MLKIFQDKHSEDKAERETTNQIQNTHLVRIISNPKDIKQQIDEWVALANDPSHDTVFYLDTEVAGFRTKGEQLSTIQCLLVSRERRKKDNSALFSDDDCVVPYSLREIMEEEQVAKSSSSPHLQKESIDSSNFDENVQRHNIPEDAKSFRVESQNYMNITASLINDLKNACIDDALPNGKIVILDVLNCEDIVDYFVDNIMYNEHFEKVFHFKSFDLKYLGGAQYCKNVTCTHEISSKFMPYHLLPVSNFKLDTLTNHMIQRIRHYFSSIDEHFENNADDSAMSQLSLSAQNEILRILTYSNKKELQESDWFTRPLTTLQMEYAAQDVIVLFALHRLLLYMLVREDSAFHCLSYLKKLYKDRSGITFNDDEDNDENIGEENSSSLIPSSVLNSQLFDHAQHLASIENSMKSIEHEYKLLESKMMTLQERVKEVMLREGVHESSCFKLSSSKRTTIQVPLSKLVEHVGRTDINFPMVITSGLKKALHQAGVGDIPQDILLKKESYSHRFTKKTSE
nr:unnamed protein product [Naegleria fowleri]